MKSLVNKVIKLLVKWCEKTGRTFLITGEASQKDDVYLVRYIVFKSKYLSFYIHRFLRSDSSDPHDHPWNFFTYIVEGEYEEHFYDRNVPQVTEYFGSRSSKGSWGSWKFQSYWTKTINVRKSGSLAYRRANDIHRVVVDRTYGLFEREKAPLTACLMFNRQRTWGFWPLKNKGTVMIDWRKYLKIKPFDNRIQGSE